MGLATEVSCKAVLLKKDGGLVGFFCEQKKLEICGLLGNFAMQLLSCSCSYSSSFFFGFLGAEIWSGGISRRLCGLGLSLSCARAGKTGLGSRQRRCCNIGGDPRYLRC